MIRPAEWQKAAANDFARLVAGQSAGEALRCIADFEPPGVDSAEHASGNGAAGQAVGIWHPTEEGGHTVYRRAAGGSPWSLWAQVGAIRLHPERRRIVFLGESVARGFFYDPHLNPAGLLSKMLNDGHGDGEIDVIDLAKVSIERAELLELTRASLRMDPHAVVIFAGNNWHPVLSLSEAELEEVRFLLRSAGDLRPVQAYMDGRLRAQVRGFLEELSALARERGVPVVFVIPEFNLRDWIDARTPPPIFDAACNAEWLTAEARMRAAMEAGDAPGAAEMAARMTELDNGTSPLPLRVLGEQALRDGRTAEARTLFERARDAGCSHPQAESPRCHGAIQDVVRQEAPALGIRIVDLPAVFAEYLGGELPDRRLFHDYCHLTAEGMRVAMAAVAGALQPEPAAAADVVAALTACVEAPAAEVEAEAHLLAAVHNANWGQPQDIVEYHCTAALRASPRLAPLLALYLDSHVRRQPAALCESFTRLVNSLSLSAMNVLLAPPQRRKALSLAFVRGASRALQQAGVSDPVDAEALLLAEHALRSGSVDLLDRRYCTTSYAALEGDWPERGSYYQAFSPRSRFTLIGGGAPVTLDLTWRTPSAPGGASALLRLNGAELATLTASETWTSARVQLPADLLGDGINELEIAWPEASWNLEEQVGRACAAWGTLSAAMYPVFGEVHHLRAAVHA
jgi:hypothetical protein